MATIAPVIVIKDGEVVGIWNRDPANVNPHTCNHNPAPGEPRVCNCVHDWAIAGPVGVRNAETGSSDINFGPLPLPQDQQGLPK